MVTFQIEFSISDVLDRIFCRDETLKATLAHQNHPLLQSLKRYNYVPAVGSFSLWQFDSCLLWFWPTYEQILLNWGHLGPPHLFYWLCSRNANTDLTAHPETGTSRPLWDSRPARTRCFELTQRVCVGRWGAMLQGRKSRKMENNITKCVSIATGDGGYCYESLSWWARVCGDSGKGATDLGQTVEQTTSMCPHILKAVSLWGERLHSAHSAST